jgi:sigma-B regulation protein RsbU (phosphoserine phosphatase)
MRHWPLAFRLSFWVGVPAVGLFFVVVLLSSIRSRDHVMQETETSSRNLARFYAQRIEGGLTRASVVAEMIGTEMEISPKPNEATLNRYLGDVVASKDFIYGSCIAFEPFTFDPAREYLAPYYYWKGSGPQFVQLGNPEYNYFKWDWYRIPKELGRPFWCEPYFDEGGGETIMTTYSVPFHRDGKFWGIATIDIAMNNLTREVEKIRMGKSGYAFVVSKKGKFLSFPDPAQIMKGSLWKFDAELARRMTSGEDGFIRSKEPLRHEDVWTAFVPIKTGDLSLAVVYPEDEIMASAFALQRELLLLGVVGLLALFAALVLVMRSISKPVTQLSLAAQRIAAGDLDFQLTSRTRTQEVSNLTQAFQKMTSDLKRRMEELRSATAAKERIEGELHAARTIQMSILPLQFPAFPERAEFSIHAQIRPAREIGGDFYDFFFVDGDWLCVLIGDVAGKGVPAALYMAVTTTLVRACTVANFSPANVLHRVNRELCGQRDTGMFVTMFYALLNCRTGSLVYCNAGHHAPFILSENGAFAQLAERGGVALGASSHARYENSEIQLKTSDTLFCFTDGVTEALSSEGSFYTEARLAETVQKNATLSPDLLTASVLDDLHSFAAKSAQADDLTVLALKFLQVSSLKNASESPATSSAIFDQT